MVLAPTPTTPPSSATNNTIHNSAVMTKNCHVDLAGINGRLDEADKDTEYMRAWVAIRSKDHDDMSEDSDDDDNSVDYLAEAVSDFFRKICFCHRPTTTAK